jgi:hypothetical protein
MSFLHCGGILAGSYIFLQEERKILRILYRSERAGGESLCYSVRRRKERMRMFNMSSLLLVICVILLCLILPALAEAFEERKEHWSDMT